MTKPLNLIGKTFGKLVVLRRAANTPTGQTMWEAKCACGNVGVFGGSKLKSGHTSSCGCLAVESIRRRSTKHGQGTRAKRSRAYSAWKEMKRRCYNPNSISYAGYGARGITVCEEWRTSFETFFAYMGDCPEGYELDRLDNNKGYEPNNVRWASETTQSRNRRYCKLSEDKADAIREDKRPSRAVAKEYGVSKTTILAVRSETTWKDK